MSELTKIERAVVAMLQKPLRAPAPWADLPALFILRANEDPDTLMRAVYNSVDWTVINEHVEQRA
jgi:hypothetical protein